MNHLKETPSEKTCRCEEFNCTEINEEKYQFDNFDQLVSVSGVTIKDYEDMRKNILKSINK